MSWLCNSLTVPLCTSQAFEVTFGESLCIASDDNGRKLGCVYVSACVRFHCAMRFQWHPDWCAVVFSSHCNSDSKTVCLIVLWSFHVLHKAGKLGQGNGCFVLCTLRIGTLQNLGADNNTLMVLISSSSSLFTQWLKPPVESRYDLFEVRVEVYIHIPHSSHVAFIKWGDLQEPHPPILCLMTLLITLSLIAVHQQASRIHAIQYKTHCYFWLHI